MNVHYGEYYATILATSDTISPIGLCYTCHIKNKEDPCDICIKLCKNIYMYKPRHIVCQKCHMMNNTKRLCGKCLYSLSITTETPYITWFDQRRVYHSGHKCECEIQYPHLCKYTGVTVQVREQPIKHKPSDVTFQIRIWTRVGIETECIPELFIDSDIVAEFCISPTEDPIDLERRYGDILRLYDVTKVKSIDYSFSAPSSKEHYIKEFKQRINNILSLSSSTERIAMENGHFARREKGYSHS